MSGRLLGDRYELLRRIGAGGMAEVWEATDHSLGRRVAIKLLHHHLAEDSSVLARFRSEAQAAARLTHPGVVSIYDTVTTTETDAIVMELVEGQDLRSVLDERGTLAVDDAIEVAIQVAQALGHAHQNGIVHRDVKPANILVRPDRRVKLSDFGIAKALDDSTFTEAGSLVGTVKYLAPEQIQGHPVDGRTDLYALSTVLFEMLCGSVPFASQDLIGSMDRVKRPAPRARDKRPDLPVAVDEFLARGLARNPNDRPADANSYAASLIALRRPGGGPGADTTTTSSKPFAASTPKPAPSGPRSIPMRTPEPPPARTPKRRRRSRLELLWPVIAAVLMIAALVTVWMLLRPARDSVSDRLGSDPVETSIPESDATDTSVQATSESSTSTEAETTTTPATTTIPFVNGMRAIDWDPLGKNGEEHPEATGRALDDDPDTFWYTEGYETRSFGGIKEGVGLIIEFEEPTLVSGLVVSTNNVGWAAEIYEADQVETVFENWGEPIGEFTDLSTDTELALPAITTTAVLVWLTDLGEGEPLIRLEVYELSVVG